MGNYDLPVTIDYILNITNQQNLYFLGHSIGSSAGFISCSLRPEYNKKIRLFLALGPLANVRHTLNPLHKIIFSMGSALVVSSPTHTRTLHRNVTFKQFIESMDIHEVLPRREYASKLVKMACEDGSPLQKLCLMTIFSIVGDDFGELDTVRTNTPRDHLHPVLFQTTFPRFVRFYPAGTSLKVVANVIQYYLSGGADTPPESKVQKLISGEFARGDFGSAEANRVHYNSSTPPLFDLSKVTAPVSLHYGPGDLLVTQDDVDDLSKRLPNVVGKFKISHKHFNHLDFVLAVNARCLLYDSLLRVMRKYR
jgi:lysosomal acid lipase/cholesteryl ester hydrolase